MCKYPGLNSEPRPLFQAIERVDTSVGSFAVKLWIVFSEEPAVRAAR
jgi:hypothetical protein